VRDGKVIYGASPQPAAAPAAPAPAAIPAAETKVSV
jgi:hypothetical protein